MVKLYQQPESSHNWCETLATDSRYPLVMLVSMLMNFQVVSKTTHNWLLSKHEYRASTYFSLTNVIIWRSKNVQSLQLTTIFALYFIELTYCIRYLSQQIENVKDNHVDSTTIISIIDFLPLRCWVACVHAFLTLKTFCQLPHLCCYEHWM